MKTFLAVFLLAAVASGSRLVSGSRGIARAAPSARSPQFRQAGPDVSTRTATDGREGVQVHDSFLDQQHEVSPGRLPRMIWSAWLNGDPDCTAPYLNRVCLHMWGGMNSDTWNLTVLNYRTVFQVFPELRAIFEREPRTLTAQSDLVRLSFLSKFGGVWVDASLLPVLRLDSYIDDYVGHSGFFSYRLERRQVSAWFLASYPGNALVEQWRAEFLHRWQHKPEFEYFEVNSALGGILNNCTQNPKACAVWPATPGKSSRPPSGPLMCLRGCDHLFTGTAQRKWPAVLKRPYQFKPNVPDEWWDEYFAAVRLDRPKILCNS
jgi:hypothetical protein